MQITRESPSTSTSVSPISQANCTASLTAMASASSTAYKHWNSLHKAAIRHQSSSVIISLHNGFRFSLYHLSSVINHHQTICDYGVKESWTKQYVIGPFSGIERFLGNDRSGGILLLGEKILLVKDNGQVVLYNLSAQEIKNLQVRGHIGFRASQAIVYVESLVSIMGWNVIENYST